MYYVYQFNRKRHTQIVYIYTYTHIHIYTYTHIHIYTYTHMHIYTYTHIHMYDNLSTFYKTEMYGIYQSYGQMDGRNLDITVILVCLT